MTLEEILQRKTILSPTVMEYYELWRKSLLSRCSKLFVWKGLPFSQTALELINITNGFGVCVFKGNLIFPAFATPSKFSSYFITEMLKVNYTTTHVSGNVDINDDNILFKNDNLMLGMIDFINQYALMLAHVDITIIQCAINARESNGVPICMSDTEKDSVIAYRNSIANGEYKPIQDKTLSFIDWVVKKENNVDVSKFIELKHEILRNFYEDIGVRTVSHKKANLIAEEVEFDLPRLRLNVDDYLECRKIFASQLSKRLDRKITVDFSESIKDSLKRGELDANFELE